MPQEIWKAWVVQGAAESNSEIFSLDGMIKIWLEPVCVCYKLMLHIVITMYNCQQYILFLQTFNRNLSVQQELPVNRILLITVINPQYPITTVSETSLVSSFLLSVNPPSLFLLYACDHWLILQYCLRVFTGTHLGNDVACWNSTEVYVGLLRYTILR